MKIAEPKKTKPTISFQAKISLPESVITLPKSASSKLPSQNKIMIEGIINYIPFRMAVTGLNFKLSKVMHDALHINTAKTVKVEITRVNDEPEIRIPADLKKALAASKPAQKSWVDITAMARRDWIFSICTAKQPETRARRIEKARDMLTEGKRRLCCFPGVKWMMKKDAKIFGMWLPLPKQKA